MVHTSFELLYKGNIDLFPDRDEVMVLSEDHLVGHFGDILEQRGVRVVFKVLVADEITYLAVVVVDLFLIDIIDFVHVKRIELNLLSWALFHGYHIDTSAELFLSFVRNGVVERLGDNNRPIINFTQLIDAVYYHGVS